MREILFRAKRLDNGEWVEGALFDGKKYCVIGQEIKFSPYIENECKIVGYKIDRNTICQYTGLTDKNGNKIWENDIVRDCDCSGAYSIKYFAHTDYPAFDCYPEIPCDCNGLSYLVDTGFCEVIGNIFDNPELLENE